jgi:serine/threonine protein kinase
MTEPLILPLGPGDPQHLGGHQLIGLLGHGGMGRVYLGISADGGQVAVKVMHPHYAGDSAFRERFKREAETAQRISGRFTAKVLDSGVDERTPGSPPSTFPGPRWPSWSPSTARCPTRASGRSQPGWRRR